MSLSPIQVTKQLRCTSENLYPSIPIDKALELVEKLLSENEDLGETTAISVTSIMELLIVVAEVDI